MKTYKKNYLYVVMYNVLSIITPLVTAPYISRVLGVEGIGTYSYYYAIAYYFTLIAKMGLTNYGTRRIAEVKDDEEKLSKEFSSIYFMQIFFGIITSIVYFIAVFVLYQNNKVIGLIFGIWVVGNVFNTDWVLFGIEKFRQTSTINMIIKIIEVISIFIFIKNVNDLWKYCLICAIGYFGCYLYFLKVVFKSIKITKVARKNILTHFWPCLLLMIPVIALNVYRSMDKVMLGYMSDMVQTGYYENAEKIIYTLTMFISSLGTVMMPRASSMLSKGKQEEIVASLNKSLNFIYFITSAMCFGVLAVSKSLVPWFFGEEFYGSIILLDILAITLILIGIGNVLRTQYIIPSKKDNIYIKSISLGAIINLVVNIILIPRYQAIGACIATVIAELVVPVYQYIMVKDEIKVENPFKNVIFYVVCGLMMFAALKCIENVMGTGFKTLIVQVISGGIIYMSLTYYKTKNMVRINIFSKGKRIDI